MKKIIIIMFVLFPVLVFAGMNEDFISAVKKGDVKKAEAFLKKGADINTRDQTDVTWGETALIIASTKGDRKMVKMLLAKGADPNFTNESFTALNYASMEGHLEVVKMLVEKGADVNAKDGNGMTTLMSACSGGNSAVVKYLIENGADAKTKDPSGNTAADYTKNSEIKALLENTVKK